MLFKSEILLVTNEPKTESDVRATLEDSDSVTAPRLCHDIPAMLSYLEQRPVHFVLVDIDGRPMRLLEELEQVVNRFVHTRFIVLCSEMQGDVVFRAMQAGVRHVQLKARMASELREVLTRLAPNSPIDAMRQGGVITLLSASGGCGATTLAVNLANELQLSSTEPVLIVDLDVNYGAVATYLELSGYYGIADVLSHEGGIDPQLINTTAVRHSHKLHVLLSPATIDFSATHTLKTEGLPAVVQCCKHDYLYTIIDAPRVSMDVAATLAADSDLTLIVLQPSVKDLRVAKAMLQALRDRGVPEEHVRPLINRYRTRHQMITYEEAHKVLGGIPLERISNDYSSALRGINYGKPLSNAAPRSALRREVVKLAEHVFQATPHNGATKS